MKLESFFENFDLLSDAPNAVAKFRQLILELAVRGMLVPQNQRDETASVLLEKIGVEKDLLIKEGKIRRTTAPPIVNEEIPYEIPPDWQWVRLDSLVEVITKGSSPKWQGVNYVDSSSGILFITSENVRNYFLDLTEPKYVEVKFNEIEPRSILRKGDILMNIVGASIGRTAIYNYDGVANINQAVCLIRMLKPGDLIDLNYMLHFFNSAICVSLMLNKQVDNARANLSMGNIAKFSIPLPPLPEQKRIVEKCDRLMTLCDQIEQRQQERQKRIVTMNEGAIAQLLSAQNPDEFTEHWNNICNNFDLLYSVPETVPKLRQAILQLAVMGKLVRQEPGDESARALLEKLNLLKGQLNIGQSSSSSKIALDAIPYTLPESWEWAHLGEVVRLMDSGWSPACMQHPTRDSSTWGVLKTTAVQSLNYQYEEHKELPQHLRSRPEYEVKPGDILITRAGPKNRVGICCLVEQTRSKLMISDKIIRFHLFEELLCSDFIVLSLNAGFSQSYLEAQKSGMAESQMNISQTKLRTTPIPLPPLAEQKRIVAKVDRLMSLCDALEAKLQEVRGHSEKLVEVAARQVLVA